MRQIIAWSILLLTAIPVSASQRQKVLFDCDLGGDIDDAFAVALLLTSPELEVMGLVMDHGNTPGRARVATRLLWETGREEIPVVIGRHTPGVVGQDTELAGDSNQMIWARGFSKLEPSPESGADFIIRTLRENPNEVILITVGPVPNIADVLERDPESLKLAQRIISMFGSFHMGYDESPKIDAEWNVRADIDSSKAFIEAGLYPTLAGLDTTTMVKLGEADRMRLVMRASPLTDALTGLYTMWRYDDYSKPDPTLFDVVPVAMVLWPELFSTRPAHVRVDDSGFTIVEEDKEPNCEIGTSVDVEQLVSRAMDRYLKQNLGR